MQTEAYDYPAEFFRRRVWRIMRNRDRAALERAAELIRASRRPMIVAGGGVIYADATDTLAQFVHATGIPVGKTMAAAASAGTTRSTWKRSRHRHAGRERRRATQTSSSASMLCDFTTSSKTAWQNPGVRFVNINVTEFDAGKHQGLQVVGDA